MRIMPFIPLFLLVLMSCGNDETSIPKETQEMQTEVSGESGASHHGAIVALGNVELGGEKFAVNRQGACETGVECAFAVTRLGSESTTGLYLWVEDPAGEQVSAPAQSDRSGDHWHFHVTPRTGAGKPAQVVVRLREGDRDERASLPLHHNVTPAHDGVAAPLLDTKGRVAGWLELKLHDDKGDLELWLTENGEGGGALDISLDATPVATFPGLDNRMVKLNVRNTTKNEDENGVANIRGGRTNYFIFPGGTGADASWLMGADFKSTVSVSLHGWAATLSTLPFVLVPHSHGPGGHHH